MCITSHPASVRPLTASLLVLIVTLVEAGLWCSPECTRMCVYACVISHVWLFVTPWTVACRAPLSTGILQGRILEWAAVSSSGGSSWPRDQTYVSCASCNGRQVLYRCATWEVTLFPPLHTVVFWRTWSCTPTPSSSRAEGLHKSFWILLQGNLLILGMCSFSHLFILMDIYFILWVTVQYSSPPFLFYSKGSHFHHWELLQWVSVCLSCSSRCFSFFLLSTSLLSEAGRCSSLTLCISHPGPSEPSLLGALVPFTGELVLRTCLWYWVCSLLVGAWLLGPPRGWPSEEVHVIYWLLYGAVQSNS